MRQCQNAPMVAVYPHVCGGIYQAAPVLCLQEGLSPRVRGHRVPAYAGGGGVRSIPTCAGASFWSASLTWRTWVYPHVCGGIDIRRIRLFENEGLSPRVRGHRSGIVSPAL